MYKSTYLFVRTQKETLFDLNVYKRYKRCDVSQKYSLKNILEEREHSFFFNENATLWMKKYFKLILKLKLSTIEATGSDNVRG